MSDLHIVQWILGTILILSALGVILLKKPVHASLSFLVTLLTLATFYLQLNAEFIGVMQIIVYAGAILVLFMFVIILFQDAYLYIEKTSGESSPFFLLFATLVFLAGVAYFAKHISALAPKNVVLNEGFGMVASIGKTLYVDFFFPFEAVIMLFLIAVVGSLYLGRKVS